MASVHVHVSFLIGSALLLRSSQGQPICSVIAPNVVAQCDLSSLPDGISWPAAGIYRSVANPKALVPPNKSIQPIPVVKLHAGKGFRVNSFYRVHPPGVDSWANTPEGEWSASVDEHDASFWSALKLNNGGACALASVSVYRPESEELTLRLNFKGCSGPRGGPHHASIEVGLSRSSTGGGSGIVEWMCDLMPHKACWGLPTLVPPPPTATTTTPAPRAPLLERARHLTVHLNLQYFLLGQGHCSHRGMAPERHSHATSVSRCADACAASPADAAGGACTGFAFSHKVLPYCLVYSSIPVSSHAHPEGDDWACYAVSNSSKTAETAPIPSTSTAPASPQHSADPAASTLAVGVGATVLSLHDELGGRGLLAFRRRLAPVQPGCYKPFDWISITGGLQATLALNHSSWDMLARRLPVVPRKTAAIDGTVVADHVCVEVGHGGGCGQSSEVLEQEVETDVENTWWEYLIVVLVSASVSILCTVIVARQCCGATFSRSDRRNFETAAPREEEPGSLAVQ